MDDCGMQTNKNKRAPEQISTGAVAVVAGWRRGGRRTESRLASTLRKVEKDDDEGGKIRSIQERCMRV